MTAKPDLTASHNKQKNEIVPLLIVALIGALFGIFILWQSSIQLKKQAPSNSSNTEYQYEY